MRCSLLPSTIGPGDEPCLGTATHLLIGSLRADEGEREPFGDPVCRPCGESSVHRPRLNARIVPLHIHTPTPAFKSFAGGHRLVHHAYHEAACHDCMLLGSVEYFRQGRATRMHGCRMRPESVSSDVLPKPGGDRALTLAQLASLWWTYTTEQVGMNIEDWLPIDDDPLYAASFTFRQREYALLHTQSGRYVFAKKLENRGRFRPDEVGTEYKNTYKQVIFHFDNLFNKYGSRFFAAYTPGQGDIILHAPEGQISGVLRISGLDFPNSTHLAQITEAVADAFGAVASLTFQERVYGTAG